MFEPLPAQFSFPQAEERVLEFWEKHKIFARSLEQRQASPRFVFYEGPPTANGLPHPGHCLTRAIKDLFPRYQTMCGKLVERKAGWDTHGLPVEVEVCKELGIHTKEEIENYGVEKFIRKCIESVFRYTREWEQMTRRLGFWVNLEEAYVTFHQSYVESVWWSLKTLFDRGLLYQGHKVVWWWAQGGTALSAGEVGEGYRTVRDPSVYVRFPLVTEGAEGATQRRSDEATKGAAAVRDSLTALELIMAIEDRFGSLSIPDEDAEQMRSAADALNYIRAKYPLVWQKAVAAGVVTESGAAAVPVAREGEAPAEPPHVRLPNGPKVALLVWTTTPWTLISNHFAAVGPDIDYSLVHDKTTDEYLYIAAALVAPTANASKHQLEVVAPCKGADLIGLRYTPPFDSYAKTMANQSAPLRDGGTAALAWRIVPADFVDLQTGTGIVHIAPAYGEVDFNLLQEERQRFDGFEAIPLINAVKPDGTFSDEASAAYRGRWVKDCDKEIMRELRDRGILFYQDMIEHEYPFCPRAEDDPLIQYARKSWFVRTSQFKEAFLANNDKINWLPEHIQEGRFGDFLRNNVDWAISRERYWGTPLPIWVCEKTGKMEAVGSYAELLAKPGVQGTDIWAKAKQADPTLPDHLKVHKPYIDEVTYESPFAPGARMRRVPEVIDCWWDAGSMPFAQWGFPHASGSIQTFTGRFPADFISEAIDQTRGWFYGLLAISTLLFGAEPTQEIVSAAKATSPQSKPYPTDSKLIAWLRRVGVLPQNDDPRIVEKLESMGVLMRAAAGQWSIAPAPDPITSYPMPYKTCIVLGHVMGEDALKMSKRTKNYKEPAYIFDTYGADAMRWYFLSAQAPWTTIRFQEANIRDAQREFLVRLYNVFSFFNIYANIDGFIAHPQDGSPWRPTRERAEIDRWIISELQYTVRFVREKMDAFENYPAAGRINDFVDALSNWYVRRSRERFWQHDKTQDKWDAYHTLYGVLLTLSQLIAPFTPFFAEVMYQNLTCQSDGAIRRGGRRSDEGDVESVHLCDYPTADEKLIDEGLAQEMELVREVVSLGRAARTAAKLKVRQPLALAEIILTRREHTGWLEAHSALIAEELNIKQVEFSIEAEQYVTYQIKPDFKAIGPKFGKLAPQVAAALAKLDAAAARKELETTGRVVVVIDSQPTVLTEQEVAVRLEARPGWSAAQGRSGVVVVKTELTAELRDEGLCRELIHQVQALRKEHDLAYEARITLYVQGPDRLRDIAKRFAETIQAECLAVAIQWSPPPAGTTAQSGKIEGHAVTLAIATVS